MQYTVIYKDIKHGYVRVKDGKIVITLSKRLQWDEKILQRLLVSGKKLLKKTEQQQKIRALWVDWTTVFGEEIAWEELGLENKTPATREKYLKKMLLEYTEELTHYYAEQLSNLVGKKYFCNSVKIKKLKSKWGYCTSRQDIVYALQLLHLPNAWIRYVIIHEVCHLREKNHSSKFWGLVEQLCPDYKSIKKKMGNIRLEG